MRRLQLIAFPALLACSHAAAAQDLRLPPFRPAVELEAAAKRPHHPRPQVTSLSGPRFGLTVVSGELADSLKARYDARPTLTQFGWQFETRMFQVEGGMTGMTELVGLVAGLDQGIAIPSLSWLVAMRSPTGFEFGVGPNVSPAGAALAGAVGVNIRQTGGVNIPMNLALVSGKGGPRMSILFGFYIDRGARRRERAD